MLRGSCLCGGVRYEVSGALSGALNCHCSMCRKAQGAAFRSRARVRAEDFRWVQGEELVTYYESSPGNHRGFCRVCGSPLLSRFDHDPAYHGLPLGALDDDPGVKPRFHVYVADKAPWFDISDELPQFAQRPNSPRVALPASPIAGVRVIELVAGNEPLLRAFFEANPEYFHIIQGGPAASSEADEEINGELPAGWTYTKKWVLGYVGSDGSLIAVANLVSDILAPRVWNVSTFIVATARHGTGDAQLLYRGLEHWAEANGATWLRLGVVLGNTRGERFWETMGYGQTRLRHGVKFGARTNTLRVMFKPLAGGTLEEYLLVFPRDRPMHIEIDDLSRPEIHALLNEHLQSMYALSPPESVHALDLERLRRPEITFWTAWDGPTLLGCGALKELDAKHGEIKSMRTPTALRRRGAGREILRHIIGVATSRNYERLSLETGSQPAFEPAQRLYASFGFVRCGPFGDYVEDPNSVFMSLALQRR